MRGGVPHLGGLLFSLAIDFFDEFGLERLAEPEKPWNKWAVTVNNSLTKNELLLKKIYHRVKEIGNQHPKVINIACES